MAIGPSAFLVNSWLKATFCGQPFVVAQPYLQPHDGDPGSGGLSNVIDIDRQPTLFGEPSPNGYVVTAGPPIQYVVGGVEDTTFSHFSVHTALDGGDWLWNLVANKPIPVVDGDLLIVSDQVSFQIDGWVV